MLVFSSLDSRTIWEVLFFNTILDKPSLDRWLISETNPGCWNIQAARDWAPVCPLRFSPFSFITDPTTTTTKNIQAARYWTKINWQPPMSTHIFTVSVQKLVHPKKDSDPQGWWHLLPLSSVHSYFHQIFVGSKKNMKKLFFSVERKDCCCSAHTNPFAFPLSFQSRLGNVNFETV